MAMTGTIILAIIVVNTPEVGGIQGMQEKLPNFVFDFFPSISDVPAVGGIFVMSAAAFFAYIAINWWASWYPGGEPGGGGYVAQRMMSAKDEKHSLFATLFFQIAHYAIRPWPWVLVGLSTLILYPDLAADQKKMGYIYAMNDYLPIGLKGLLVAAFFAAYMSTIATQLNWGSSYILNDFYRRFISKNKNEDHYVGVSRMTTIILMIISVFVTLFIERISGAWEFIMEAGAGVGLVLILRWFWWRINAWSEISAMITPFVVIPFLKIMNIEFPISLYYIVPITTIVWLIVTYITKPTEEKTLIEFYRKVHPGGFLWKEISSKLDDVESDKGFVRMFINWILGVILVYSILFGTGSLIFGNAASALIYLMASIISVIIIYKNLQHVGWTKLIN
jgi:Na+/proline symporter